MLVAGCGTAGCKTLPSGQGACRCEAVPGLNGDNAVCSGFGLTSDDELRLDCDPGFGIVSVLNCKYVKDSDNGHCATFVNAYGSATACFYDDCLKNEGDPLCPGGAACTYLTGNIVQCL